MLSTIKDPDRELSRAVASLKAARRVCALTGAGVSAESGVPTFRASDGLWEGHRIEDVASPSGFRRNPTLVWDFYNARRLNLTTVQPNLGHHALFWMEKHWGERFTLVTQNVDGLHRLAGNKNLLEIHGSLYKTRCTACERLVERDLQPLGPLPKCECGGLLRPDIVWFHEPLPEDIWARAFEAAEACDVFLVIGTSAVVHPAASLIPIAKQAKSPGATIIEINLVPTEASEFADIGLYGPSGQILPKLVDLIQS